MPAKSRRKPVARRRAPRRPRRPINWTAWLGFLLVANLVAGFAASPLTTVRKLRVEGLDPGDAPALRQIARLMDNRAALRVDPREVETAFMAIPGVERVDFRRNLFGRALAKVTYREPVLRVRNTADVALDARGVFFSRSNLPDDLPVVELPPGEPSVLLTITGATDGAALASLVGKTAALAWPGPLMITVDARGVVCLNKDSGRVNLGDSDNLDSKLGVLESWLRDNPDGWKRVRTLNLTDPENPAFEPRTP